MDQEVQVLKRKPDPQSLQRRTGALLVSVIVLLAAVAVAVHWTHVEGWRKEMQRLAYNRRVVARTARLLGLSEKLMLAVAEAESSFDERAVSHKGARGLMQLMPSTAREVAAGIGLTEWDIDDARDNALLGGTYLRSLLRRYHRDLHLALAAYHAGPRRVDTWIARANGLPGPEIVEQFASAQTREYVFRVTRQLEGKMAGDITRHGRVREPGLPDGEPGVERFAHTVQPGETLSGIAERYGVSVSAIVGHNRLADRHNILPGQVLLLRQLPGREQAGLPAPDEVEVRVFKAGRKMQVVVGEQVVRSYDVALGREPLRDKHTEGDGCTPEGRFYVCQKLPEGRYGPSLGLSYPDTEDADRGLEQGLISRSEHERIYQEIATRGRPPWDTRLGGAICIHGRGSGRDWTQGCVALDDADAFEIFALVPMKAPVAIYAQQPPDISL